jgi:putative nucleotidyltransferase with HDIG domain
MNSEQEKIIKLAGDLPTIPVVATKVMQLVQDEMATAEELAKVVASDPAVTARIMKISNSAFYGCQRQIQTLPGAIMLLGFNTLKSLVVVASVKEVFKPFGLTEKMLWEHSFGAGLAARLIAREIKVVNPEEAFLAGLLHDIGKIIMHNHDRDKFQMVIERHYNEGISFEDAEKGIYPFTHAELGGCVMKKWNFPKVLVSAVNQHHTFAFDEDDDYYQRTMTAIASLSNLFCLKLGIGTRNPQTDLELADSTAALQLKLGEDRLTPLLENFGEIYEKDKGYFC